MVDPNMIEKIRNSKNAKASQRNVTTSIAHNGIGTVHEFGWSGDNTFAEESINFSNTTVANMMKDMEAHDFEAFDKDNANLPWLDRMLANQGIIPNDITDDTTANTMFSRGGALYMFSNVSDSLGFVGNPYYADSLGESAMYSITVSDMDYTENREARKNCPSHMSQQFTSPVGLTIIQRKFITYGNSAVTVLEFINTSSTAISFDMAVSSPFVTRAENNELIGENVASPLMVGIAGTDYVEAMSHVDVRINGTGMMAATSNTLVKSITVPAGETLEEKVVMGWLAREIPQSYADYQEFSDADASGAFRQQVTTYNQWWAENIPYIDIPDKNIKKVIYYRWWCNRFNFLQGNIPGNDWQFPMNMEGVLGYNNGITVSAAWAMSDIKWLRDPSYVYGTWLSQGEYSAGVNYKNNPGRPNIWTWDMMQNISDVGWKAYKIHGGGRKVLDKFTRFADDDVNGSLKTFSANSADSLSDSSLIYYSHGPITGNDGDTVSMYWNTASGNNYARIDGSATIYANAVAAAHMYGALGDMESAQRMYAQAAATRTAMLKYFWHDDSDFDGDGEDETNGMGSFLHVQASTGLHVPWRDNNMFAFSMGVVPKEGEDGYDEKYKTQLYDYGDDRYYPVFPFFTADQTSIEKRIQAWVDGDANAYGTNQFAFCNFGNFINVLAASLRYYPVGNITTGLYSELFGWGSWMHTILPGSTAYLDANEFFWLTGYYFGTEWTPDNPPSSTGNVVRSWIHHDTLGMMDYTVIEDMAGLQPREDDKIELWPLGVDYEYFTIDNIRYHNSDLTIVWQDPAVFTDDAPHYEGIPVGYSLYIDSVLVMNNNEMSHVIYNTATGEVELPEGDVDGAVGSNANTVVNYQLASPASRVTTALETSLSDNERLVDIFNKAGVDIKHDTVNLAMADGTMVELSYANPDSSLANLVDGNTAVNDSVSDNLWYYTTSFSGTPNTTDSITFTFSESRTVDNVKIHFYNDRLAGGYTTPLAFGVLYLDENGGWQPVVGQERYPEVIASNYNSVAFRKVATTGMRINITHETNNFSTAVTELLVFDNDLGITAEVNHNVAPVVALPGELSAETETETVIVPMVSDDGIPTGELFFKWEFAGFSGTGDDLDGGYVIGDDRAKDLAVTFDSPGTYIFNYTVSDGELSTTVVAEITVTVSTAELLAMIARFSDTQYLSKNPEDYEAESWAALQGEIRRIQSILTDGNYTSTVINECIDSLQAYINALVFINIALLAEPSTNYVSPWETLDAVNDGFIPFGPAIYEQYGCLAYGNWGGAHDTYWVEYTWDEVATVNGASVYFYNDSGGIQNPGAYWYEYYDDSSGGWITLDTMETEMPNGYAVFNTVAFSDEITAARFRIQMTKAGTSIWNGIKEFRVLGSYTPEM